MRPSFLLWAIVLGASCGASVGAALPVPDVRKADQLIRWVDIDLGVVCYGRRNPPADEREGWEARGTLSCVKLFNVSGGDL